MGEPQRVLGTAAAVSLIAGSVIGSGIFLAPAYVAQAWPAPGGIMLVWIAGGILSLFAALSLAELGAMFPRAGGQYVFLQEAFGPATGFLFGWMALVVNYTGTVAAVAVGFALYAGVFFPVGSLGVKFVAIGLIWVLTLVNIRGVRQGSWVQTAALAGKLAGILFLVGAGLLVAGGGSVTSPVAPVASSPLAVAFILALVPALFAFDGFGSATFVAGEIKDPQRTIPRAHLMAVGIVTVTYIALTATFLHVLPIDAIAGNERVAADVGLAILGSPGSYAVAAAVLVSTFGTVNGYVLQSPRIYYAMAKDGALYSGFGRLHPTFSTPVFGLILQAEWASMLVLSGSFNQLITYVIMSSWVFNGFTGVALLRLRRTQPDTPRPYRVWGYPATPILFVAAAFIIVATSLVYDTRNSIIGVALALSGLPVFWLIRRRASN